MTQKIDERLQKMIVAQSGERQIECLVRAYNEKAYKRYLEKFDKRVLQKFPFINAFSVILTKKEIKLLSTYENVEYISSVMKVSSLMNVAKKILHIQKKCFGAGQTICIIDTGLKPHGDFVLGENRIVGFVDFIDGKKECYDDNGHGTFVAGVCAGNGAMSGGKYSGVAPKSKIISLKALDGKGEADSQKILQAMQWVYEHKEQVDIVCMSFGSDPIGLNDPIMLGAEKLWDSGIVVVAAAGNSGPEYQTIKSPGVSRKIITVGGFDDNRLPEDEFNPNFFEMAPFSSRGPSYRHFKPDVIAPAVDIVSCGIDSNYTALSGTSVATPMIAGICALIKEKESKLSPLGVKNKLLSMCKPTFFDKNFEGYGVPQVDN